jgi:hypothetical protein
MGDGWLPDNAALNGVEERPERGVDRVGSSRVWMDVIARVSRLPLPPGCVVVANRRERVEYGIRVFPGFTKSRYNR